MENWFCQLFSKVSEPNFRSSAVIFKLVLVFVGTMMPDYQYFYWS